MLIHYYYYCNCSFATTTVATPSSAGAAATSFPIIAASTASVHASCDATTAAAVKSVDN